MTKEELAEAGSKAIDKLKADGAIEVAAQENGGGHLPALLGEEERWDDVGDGDLAPEETAGVLSLIPLNKKMDGGFTDIETGELRLRELDFVLLAKSRSRGAFIEEKDGKIQAKAFDAKNPDGPGCRSFDGVKADPASPLLQNGGDCTSCPLAVWNGDERPLCKEAAEAMVFLPDPHGFGRLARMRFNGIALGPFRRYWRSFNERLPKKPPIAYVTHCELVETETENGTFLAPQFSRVKEFSRAEVQPLIVERDKRLSEWQSAVATDVVEGRAAEDAADTSQRHEPFPDDDEVPRDNAEESQARSEKDAYDEQQAAEQARLEEPF